MAVFKDEAEVYQYIGGIFEEALADPVIGEKFAESGVILNVVHSDPDANFTVDMPAKKVLYGDDARNGPKPVVKMTMAADVGHQFWLGNINIPIAISKGQIRAKGPIPKILKLVPLAKSLFPKYKQRLIDNGRADIAG